MKTFGVQAEKRTELSHPDTSGAWAKWHDEKNTDRSWENLFQQGLRWDEESWKWEPALHNRELMEMKMYWFLFACWPD